MADTKLPAGEDPKAVKAKLKADKKEFIENLKNRGVVVYRDEEIYRRPENTDLIKRDNSDSSKDMRIVLLGSNYLMLDTQLLFSTENLSFTINAFDWLVNSDNTVHISSKYVADSVLRIPDATTAWVLAAVVVGASPLIVLVVGIVVWIKRRRL